MIDEGAVEAIRRGWYLGKESLNSPSCCGPARTVSNAGIAEQLAMAHPGPVSRSVVDGRADKAVLKLMEELENVLIRVVWSHTPCLLVWKFSGLLKCDT